MPSTRLHRALRLGPLALLLLLASRTAAAEEVLLEFHFEPVEGTQIALWLEDEDGNFLADVFVTQSVGKLGIGNRPGLPDFVSSWRAPYGPRESVLPIWAHRRGQTYPRITFHDSKPDYQDSLGFHESTSSAEPYHCRPLTPEENEAIIDTLTCPSPAVFQSDKGRFLAGEMSVYPPRSNIVGFEDEDDHPDILEYDELNELTDAVTGATPIAGLVVRTFQLDATTLEEGEKIVAYLEVNLEDDQNEHFEFDREDDHYVDPKLSQYGVGFYGQPSVVYRLEIDPGTEGVTSVSEYHGYSDWDGETGTIHPPDGTISTSGGSGADRLSLISDFDTEFRFAAMSHGFGECEERDLPPVENLEVRATGFDRVEVSFDWPEIEPGIGLDRVRVFSQTPATSTMDLDAAHEAPSHALCSAAMSTECLNPLPGERVEIEVNQLFGNYSYTLGTLYQDRCGVASPLVTGDATTPIQEFQTLEGFCFVATAAYGGEWVDEVSALRWFRDVVLRSTDLGEDVISFYYAYGPSLAHAIAERPWMRAATRVLLEPVADHASLGRAVHRRLLAHSW